MIELGEALRELVATVPPATRVDPYAAIQESRARRRRTRRRWTAVGAAAAVACGSLAVDAWPRSIGREAGTEPTTSVSPATGHGLDAAGVQLKIWGFTVSGWTRTDADRGETWTASLGPRPGTVSVTFSPRSGQAAAETRRVSSCPAVTCVVVDAGGGSSVDGVRYMERVVRLVDRDGTVSYAVTREFADGTRAVLTIGPVEFASDDAMQIAVPYLTPLRLAKLADAIGAPPARYRLTDEAIALCRQAVPAGTTVRAAYHTTVGSVAVEHSWPVPGQPAKKAWGGLDAAQDAAWCITQTGHTWQISAATTGAGLVVFTTTTYPVDHTDVNGPA